MTKKKQKVYKKTILQKRRSRLWRWFIPGKHNAHRPTVVRWRGTAVVAAFLVALQLVYNVTAAGQLQVLGYATDISAGGVISLMNDERSEDGLAALTYNSRLTSSATAKAKDMFADDYWAHVAPDGKGPDYFIQQAGYSYARAGENLAKGFQTSSGVVAGWMASQGHKDNVLGDYNEVGVAVMNGTLQGEKTTLVVAHYGKPVTAAPAPKPAPKPQQKSSSTSQSTASTPAPVAPSADPPKPTSKKKTAKKKTPKKIEQKVDVAEEKEDEGAPIAAISAPRGPTTPANPSVVEQLGIVLGTNWAATIGLGTLTSLLGISILSHHRAWLHNTRKHGFKLHWPTHIHHGAHIALIVAGAGFIIASVVGTVL